MERQAGKVGGLPVDEVVRADPAVDRLDGADASLQLADDVREDDVATQPDALPDQRAHCAERRRIAGFHVRDTDAVDEPVVVDATPRIDRPAFGDGIRVEMAIEEQALAAAGSTPDADRVHASGLDLLGVGLEPEPLHGVDDEPRELAFAGRARVALEADHLREEVEVLLH